MKVKTKKAQPSGKFDVRRRKKIKRSGVKNLTSGGGGGKKSSGAERSKKSDKRSGAEAEPE